MGTCPLTRPLTFEEEMENNYSCLLGQELEDDTVKQAQRRAKKNQLAMSRYDKARQKLENERKFRNADDTWTWLCRWEPSEDWHDKQMPDNAWELYDAIHGAFQKQQKITREFLDYYDKDRKALAWLTHKDRCLVGWRNGTLEPLDDTAHPTDDRTKEELLGWLFDKPMNSGKNWLGEDRERGKAQVNKLLEKFYGSKSKSKAHLRPTRRQLAAAVNLAEYKRVKNKKIPLSEQLRAVNEKMIGRWLDEMVQDGTIYIEEPSRRSRRGFRFYQTAPLYGPGINVWGPEGVVVKWSQDAQAATQKARDRACKPVAHTAATVCYAPAPQIPFDF